LHGYHYDSMNKDALMSMPFNYKALVIPQGLRVTPDVQGQIQRYRQQGVLIIDQPYTAETLTGLQPDVILPEGVAFAHRGNKDFDIYFLANQQAKNVECPVSFRTAGRAPYVYDPLTDEAMKVPYTLKDNRTEMQISLPANGSVFVVFGHPYGVKAPSESDDSHKRHVAKTETLELEPWTISFRESGITLRNQELFDWSRHSDEKIRYFSGHAVYKTTFKKRRSKGRVWLRLPDVKDVAHIRLNGVDCGFVWTAPYEVEITHAMKKKKNKLEIEVVNTWHNALRGADAGKAPYDGIWTNAKYRTKGEELLPAGLLASPELKIVK